MQGDEKMHFTVTADTDIGISKETNQDSVLFKQGSYSEGEILTFMS